MDARNFRLLNFSSMISRCLRLTLLCVMNIVASRSLHSQTVIPLYPGPIPNAKPVPDAEIFHYERDSILIVSKVSRPTLEIFLPAKGKANGTAVIVCPGGGYINLAMGYEGVDVAKRLNESGIAAFVLKYRMPDDKTMYEKEIGPLQDAQQSILLVRSRALEWGINPDRIGILGFSAGGHLASTAGTHFSRDYIPNPNHISLRPDFMVLVYPVISFQDSLAHRGSEQSLLGTHPAAGKIKEFSNEKQVGPQTPPAYLIHAKDDETVPLGNSIAFAEALGKYHIPAEVYLFEKGGHGFGMNNPTSGEKWMDHCIRWITKIFQ